MAEMNEQDTSALSFKSHIGSLFGKTGLIIISRSFGYYIDGRFDI